MKNLRAFYFCILFSGFISLRRVDFSARRLFFCGGLGLGFCCRLGLTRRLQRCTKGACPQSLGGVGTLASVFAGIGFWHGIELPQFQDRNSLLTSYHGDMRKNLETQRTRGSGGKGIAGIAVVGEENHFALDLRSAAEPQPKPLNHRGHKGHGEENRTKKFFAAWSESNC